MSREVRRVPEGWEHPKTVTGNYIPLFDGEEYQSDLDEWESGRADWDSGQYPPCASEDDKLLAFEDWSGPRPQSADYMPTWADGEATLFMMYETTSEGTPISPAFSTPEELAAWLVDKGASAFAGETASYESWLRVANGGYACSAVLSGGRISNGVDALTDKTETASE